MEPENFDGLVCAPTSVRAPACVVKDCTDAPVAILVPPRKRRAHQRSRQTGSPRVYYICERHMEDSETQERLGWPLMQTFLFGLEHVQKPHNESLMSG